MYHLTVCVFYNYKWIRGDNTTCHQQIKLWQNHFYETTPTLTEENVDILDYPLQIL